jgi:S1-C subfamily serine protease
LSEQYLKYVKDEQPLDSAASSDSFQREVYVLGSGLYEGATAELARAMTDAPGTVLKAGTGIGLGVGLSILQRRAGFCRLLSQSAAGSLGVAFAADVANRAQITSLALHDAGLSEHNVEQSKKTVAGSLGVMLGDVTVMTAGAALGIGATRLWRGSGAERIPAAVPRGENTSANVKELGMRLTSAPETAPRLEYHIDSASAQSAFGANSRCIPSMAVKEGKLHQQLLVVDAASPTTRLYDMAEPVVFRLKYSDSKSKFSGTAFLLDENGHFATAAHVVERTRGATGSAVSLELASDLLVPGQILLRDVSADVALLKFDPQVLSEALARVGRTIPTPLNFAPPTLTLSQEVALFGRPAHANRTVMTEGRLHDVWQKSPHIGKDGMASTDVLTAVARQRSHVDCWDGSSGGPLVNGNGELIGLLTGSGKMASHSTSSEHVRYLLELARKSPTVPADLPTFTIGRVFDETKGVYRVKVDGLQVIPGS